MHWEYKTIKLGATGFWVGGNLDERQLDGMMNDLGRDGWELAAAFDTNKEMGATRDVVDEFKWPRNWSEPVQSRRRPAQRQSILSRCPAISPGHRKYDVTLFQPLASLRVARTAVVGQILAETVEQVAAAVGPVPYGLASSFWHPASVRPQR